MKKIDLFADVFMAITEISQELSETVAVNSKEGGDPVKAYMAYGGLVALHDLMEVIHQSLIEEKENPDWPGEHATVKDKGGIK